MNPYECKICNGFYNNPIDALNCKHLGLGLGLGLDLGLGLGLGLGLYKLGV